MRILDMLTRMRPAFVFALCAGCAQPGPKLIDSRADSDETDVSSSRGEKPDTSSSKKPRDKNAEPEQMASDDDDAGMPPSRSSTAPRPGAGPRGGSSATAGSAGSLARGPVGAGAAGSGGVGSGGMGGMGGDAAPLGPLDASVADVGAGIIGSWEGHIVDRSGPMFDACVNVTQTSMAGPAGTTTYLGTVACTGMMTYVRTTGNVYEFTERETPPCAPNGVMHLTLNADDTMLYEWFRPGATVAQESGPMTRTDRCD